MANYKESEVVGTTYTRCNNIVIKNPLNGVKQAVFNEETVLVMTGATVTSPAKDCSLEFVSDGYIDVYDPNTNEQIGTMSHVEVYKILYSMYLTAAYKRDNNPNKYITEEELNNILNSV